MTHHAAHPEAALPVETPPHRRLNLTRHVVLVGLMGAGKSAVGGLRIGTIARAMRLELTDVTVIGEGSEANVRLRLVPTLEDR